MLLVAISCAWILGIWLGSLFNIPTILIVCSILPVPFLIIFKNQRKHLILLSFSLLFFFGGSWLYPVLSHQNNLAAAYNDRGKIEFTGFISEPPEKQDTGTQIVISIKDVNGQPVFGKALLSTYSATNLKFGDLIVGTGLLQTPARYPDFDYRSYLEGEGINSSLQITDFRIIESGTGNPVMSWIFDLREHLAESLVSVLPEPQASLCQGIVLGIRNNISQDLKFDLSVSGTAHLLAISGQNLTIITGLLLALGLFLFGRRYHIYIWLTLVIIWLYVFIIGLQAPVVRSAIMASLFLFADIFGRQKNAFPALIFGAAIMVAVTPAVLGNLSFQLSFLAMSGLIFITPFFSNLGRKAVYILAGKDSFWTRPMVAVTDSLSVSVGAVLAVWPLISYTFRTISLVGPVATVLISPALTPIILFGSLTAFTGLFSPAISQMIGWVAWLFLSYMILLAGAFSVLPGAYLVNRPLNSIFLWVYYGIFILTINIQMLWRRINTNWCEITWSNILNWTETAGEFIGKRARWFIPPLLVITILISLSALTLPKKDLEVSFLDVGEGDSILIQDSGQTILIDGGPGGRAVCEELGKKLPFWERKIDLLILTHPHLDHLAGLVNVLQRYNVKQVVESPVVSDLPAYAEWRQIINSKNIPYLTARAGLKIKLNDQTSINILNPPEEMPPGSSAGPDKNAIVALLTCGVNHVLLTSDIDNATETRLLRERMVTHSDILKIAHHGSNTSSSISFLEAVSPSIAVISSGVDNQFGHPEKEVLDRISDAGIKAICRTDLNGTITFRFDLNSSKVYLKSER